jgi:hypothetical protein
MSSPGQTLATTAATLFVVLALMACPRPAPSPVDPSDPVAGEAEEVRPGQTAPPDAGARDLGDPPGDPLGDPYPGVSPGEGPGAGHRSRVPSRGSDLEPDRPSSPGPDIPTSPPAFEPKNAPLSV